MPAAVAPTHHDDHGSASSFTVDDTGKDCCPASAAAAAPEAEDQSAPPPNPRRVVRRRHSVDFAGEHTIIEVDKPDEEIKERIWYSKDEFDIIKARNSLIVKMKKKGQFEESDEHSFRGLEHKLKEGHKQRRANKFAALNAVLEEQDRQYAKGSSCYEDIATKYERAVLNAKEYAFCIAVQDAQENAAVVVGNKPPADVVVASSADDSSAVSDLDTVCSEDTQQKKMRKLFSIGFNYRKRDKTSRRASM